MHPNDASHLELAPCPGCWVMCIGPKGFAPSPCGPCSEKDYARDEGASIAFGIVALGTWARDITDRNQRQRDFEERMLEADMG